MKSKLDKAVEIIEDDLQKMSSEHRKHIEVLLAAAKLFPTFVNVYRLIEDEHKEREFNHDGLIGKAFELTRERTPEEVMRE